MIGTGVAVRANPVGECLLVSPSDNGVDQAIDVALPLRSLLFAVDSVAVDLGKQLFDFETFW